MIDLGSALFAVTWVVVALGVLWAWRRMTGAQGFGARPMLIGLVIASFLSSAVFWVTDVLPRLSERTPAFSREADPSGGSHAFIEFLKEVDAALPAEAGVVLVNCKTGQVTDQANYILYPRRVVLRPLSMVPMGDPRLQLSDMGVAELRAAGADWVLDLEPRTWRKGAAQALIPLEAPR